MAIAEMPGAGLDSEHSVEGVERLEREWLRALVARDAEALDKIWADDYWMTLPEGTRFTKADCLAGLRHWTISCDVLAPDEPGIRLYSDAALVQGRTRVQGRLASDHLDIVVRHTAMYSWRGNRWLLVATVITRVLVIDGPLAVRALDSGPGCGC
jgi:ketosteroid isomerase-like protein